MIAFELSLLDNDISSSGQIDWQLVAQQQHVYLVRWTLPRAAKFDNCHRCTTSGVAIRKRAVWRGGRIGFKLSVPLN